MRRKIFLSALAMLCLILTAGPAGAGVPGTQKWAFTLGNTSSSSPALGPDGTIYVASYSGPRELYAVYPDGARKWAFTLSDVGGLVQSSPLWAPTAPFMWAQ